MANPPAQTPTEASLLLTCQELLRRESMLVQALVESHAQAIGWRVEARRQRRDKGWTREWSDLTPTEQECCRIDARTELRKLGIIA